MIYKSDWFTSPGNGETKFRNWLELILKGAGWHAQIFEDRQRKGIPDVSAAGDGMEAWLELKVAKKLHSVHDYLHLDHEVTAQQYRWLKDRQAASRDLYCGILVAWRTGPEEGPVEYVSYVPVGEWRGRLTRYRLMNWGMHPMTAKVEWLNSGQASLRQMLRGELTPGWGGQPLSELPTPHRQ